MGGWVDGWMDSWMDRRVVTHLAGLSQLLQLRALLHAKAPQRLETSQRAETTRTLRQQKLGQFVGCVQFLGVGTPWLWVSLFFKGKPREKPDFPGGVGLTSLQVLLHHGAIVDQPNHG